MLPGPVFNVELLTTARRARYFVSRAAYGLILLYLVWQNYQAYTWWGNRNRGEVSIREMATFASGIFGTVAIAQAVAVLVLTPALVAGVIADEKQRRTLHYLLSSRLTSGEIVLGKLAARLLLVAVYLAVALPILSLLTLFGGIPPDLVVAVYAATGSTAFFLAGLSLLVSTYARRVREAIFVVYLLELVWLVTPALLDTPLQLAWPALHEWVRPINDWIYATNPLSLFGSMARPRSTASSLMDPFAWLIGLQLGYGALFVLISVLRLRPVFRSQSAEARPAEGRRLWRQPRAIRLLSRPPIGDDPMLWKELHVVRSGGMVRWVVRACALLGLALMSYWWLYFGTPAIEELWRNGYGSSGATSARDDFNGFVRMAGTMLYVLWGLGLAAAASAGVTSEREEDTWVSLTTTLLTGPEILRAKMAGAVWSLRALGLVLLALWTFGLFVGAVHPVGFVAVIVEWVVFSAFIATLGTLLSLKSRNTTRATAATVAILMFLNGGYLMCCIPLDSDFVGPLLGLGSTPFVIALTPMTYSEAWWYLGPTSDMARPPTESVRLVVTCVLSVIVYGAAAGALTVIAGNDFDAAVGRPRRNLDGPPWRSGTGKSAKVAGDGDLV
jgi:ABC-type transport system involved in multi-copper enzyme maturation permease subunit